MSLQSSLFTENTVASQPPSPSLRATISYKIFHIHDAGIAGRDSHILECEIVEKSNLRRTSGILHLGLPRCLVWGVRKATKSLHPLGE